MSAFPADQAAELRPVGVSLIEPYRIAGAPVGRSLTMPSAVEGAPRTSWMERAAEFGVLGTATELGEQLGGLVHLRTLGALTGLFAGNRMLRRWKRGR